MDKNFLQTELEKIIRQFIISSMCNKSFKQNILMLNRPCEKEKKKHTHTHIILLAITYMEWVSWRKFTPN